MSSSLVTASVKRAFLAPDERDLCGAISWQHTQKARIREAFDSAPRRNESRAAVGLQRRGMIERAGMHVHPFNTLAPREA